MEDFHRGRGGVGRNPDRARTEASRWTETLTAPRDVSEIEATGMIASVAHLAYHLGAIRQIAKTARGPREGTF